jgi:serine O-acetyltransferase
MKCFLSDLKRYDKERNFFELWFYEGGVRVMFYLRLAQWVRSAIKIPVIRKIFSVATRIICIRVQNFSGICIPIETQIGPGFFIGHGGFGIVINGNTIIGKNCNIGTGVVIGMDSRGRVPRIGDRVWIGSGAKIIGNIEIGNDSMILPNAVVRENVPQNARMDGIPAKVIDYKGSAAYVQNLAG